jgi:hypothetical protein
MPKEKQYRLGIANYQDLTAKCVVQAILHSCMQGGKEGKRRRY